MRACDASTSARTTQNSEEFRSPNVITHTSQPIDRPCFELFYCHFMYWWLPVEVESERIPACTSCGKPFNAWIAYIGRPLYGRRFSLRRRGSSKHPGRLLLQRGWSGRTRIRRVCVCWLQYVRARCEADAYREDSRAFSIN